ncbi:MAG: NfeD family protein [Haloarculaceae archaeon]
MAEFLGYPLSLLLLLAGTALMVAEAFAPGAHFMVIGIALLVAGVIGLLLPPGLGVLAPLILAAAVVGTGVASFYVYRQFDFYGGKGTARTSDSDSLKGTTGRVTERVTPDSGEVKLDEGGFNPYYQARSMGGEIAEREEVMVIDPGGGNVVTVESVSGGVDDIDRELARGRVREREAADATAGAGDGGDADPDSGSDSAAGGADDAVDGNATGEGDATAADDDPEDEREFETESA